MNHDRGTRPHCELCSTRARCLFSTLPPSQYELFWSLARERTVVRGEFIETQGGLSTRFGVVKVGLLKGLRSDKRGIEKPIVLLGKGRLMGFSQLFAQPSPLSLMAITPVRVCEVDVAAARDIAMLHMPFLYALYKTIADFMESMAEWSHLLRQDSYLTKVCVALHLIAVEEGNHAFRIPSHTELASVLGARRETIARHISLLVEKGVLMKVDRWHGVLVNADPKLV